MNMLSRIREGGAYSRILEEHFYGHDGRRFAFFNLFLIFSLFSYLF